MAGEHAIIKKVNASSPVVVEVGLILRRDTTDRKLEVQQNLSTSVRGCYVFLSICSIDYCQLLYVLR